MVWFTEYQTENTGITIKVNQAKTIKSKFQEILVLDTPEYGKVLVLDGAIQTTEKDEFMYHEMLVHPALIKHPNPEKVLIIGGGDGGSIKEVLKHKNVKEVHLCEIDEEVIVVAQKYFPAISKELKNEKVKIFTEDGNEFLSQKENYYDVIIMDSSDPVGPAQVLFEEEFYSKVKNSLKKDGIMVAQTESPFLQKEYFKNAVREIQKVFKNVGVYLGFVPTYPAGMWSYTIASNDINIKEPINKDRLNNINTKYINEDIYTSLFSLPQFIKNIIL